jgi:hypothetical protein
MEINAIEMMNFLGNSSIHEPFDDYLDANSIKKRPKIGGNTYDPYIEVKKQGLHLVFVYSGELQKKGLIAKSPGTYLFNWLYIYLIKQDGFSPYKGPLPFGLSQQMIQQQVRALLGQPPHVTFDVTWKSNVDFYFIDGLVVAVKYSDMNGSAISIVTTRLPDNWAREQGIAPAV